MISKFDEEIDKGLDLVYDGVNIINMGIILAIPLLIIAFLFAIINSDVNKKLKIYGYKLNLHKNNNTETMGVN